MQKFVLPLLLPPLLSSCAVFTPVSMPQGTPALVFVDGQISDSADTIAHTQRRLSPQRAPQTVLKPTNNQTIPGSTAPSVAPTSQPARTSVANTLPVPGTTTLAMTGTPQPAAVLSLSPARNLTLEQWVRRIMPSGWKLAYENALRSKLNTRIVSVYTNDQWTRVLERLLAEQSIAGNIDWNTQTVTLARAGQTLPLAAPPTTIAASTSATPRNPFRGEHAAASPPVSAVPLVGTAATNKTQVPVLSATFGKPVSPVVDGKTWQAPAGKTLREILSAWISEQRCESGASANWTLIWPNIGPNAVTDYQLEAPLTFRGSFESMLDQVFKLYKNAETPLYADASRLQCLVAVSDAPARK
ncbi:TPA: toxin co-regulated pilus biosynthesis Q family protein [Kluyvera ascorbata]|nr:toxin co-regulated pilus biosynthesis Q family protein [Kluyvera ascorbata]